MSESNQNGSLSRFAYAFLGLTEAEYLERVMRLWEEEQEGQGDQQESAQQRLLIETVHSHRL